MYHIFRAPAALDGAEFVLDFVFLAESFTYLRLVSLCAEDILLLQCSVLCLYRWRVSGMIALHGVLEIVYR